ncbi:SCO family protein [Paracoccus sp. S-4012]|nr:SCO family protein [Paracoccus sp. S-4012]MRX49823.1 SCO family protein [Paracoccus sp. S-4012]
MLIIAAGISALLLLAIGGLWMAQRNAGDQFASCRQGAVAGGFEQFGGPFTLTSETGERVTEAQVFDKPSLLYFGYTFCPDVCPMDAARNGVAVDVLADGGHDVRPVMITVDPKRDTPEVMRDFTDAMHPEMLGLTGSEEEIAAVNQLWRNYYRSHDDGSDPYYLVDHMTNTYLILPEQGTVEYFGRDVTPEAMAESTACFLDRA